MNPMNKRRFFAHTVEGKPPDSWQGLEEHLRAVAELGAKNCEAFNSRDWGYCAGLWHDVGKYQDEFQGRLLGSGIAIEHSGIGAVLAQKAVEQDVGIPLSFAIAGHHTGLANLVKNGPGLPTPLRERLKKNRPTLEQMIWQVPAWIRDYPLPELPEFLKPSRGHKPTEMERRRWEFWIRLLFSALVDADRLDTELFSDPTRSALRCGFQSIAILRKRLDSFIDQKVETLCSGRKSDPVNLARHEVLEACREAASKFPGVFGLNVPTGGGKTLSALSFALNHAEQHGLRRVIVVIPYTSIIEQNTDVYREALGAENVVEHHSNLDRERQLSTVGEEVASRIELACENWDAPVIVTTSVQFFESLFSNHPSRTRKVHNIARSVIILDEVQTLPPSFLFAIVESLSELVRNYGCSLVLSTATPPALAARRGFEFGLSNARPIVGNALELAEKLKRVEYVWPQRETPAVSWPELADKLAAHKQVLAVVHRRDDARMLAQELQTRTEPESIRHLSALMCAAHRSDVLTQIRDALNCGHPCRVISTQLVEAGVDLDFPVVYRALGGLDSIVQAAGRCNREGRLKRGRVIIFRAPSKPPAGTLRRAAEIMDVLLEEAGNNLDPLDPGVVEMYFRKLYFLESLDVKSIQTLREEFNFASVGAEFKLIEDGFTKPIIVPYGAAEERLRDLRLRGPSRETLRGLQRFIVSIYPVSFSQLSAAGALEEVTEGIFTLSKPYEHLYDGSFGLVMGAMPQASPEALVV